MYAVSTYLIYYLLFMIFAPVIERQKGRVHALVCYMSAYPT